MEHHDPTFDEDGAFPSDAPQTATTRVVAKPFGQDASQRLTNRNEALRRMSRQEAFNRGYLTVKDLDDEELRYGRCRDENGHIPKRGQTYAQLIPQEKFDEMIAEHEARFRERLRQNLDTMLDVMVNVATDDTNEPRDRFEAAKYLFERTAGKTADVVHVNVKAAPWEELLGGVTGIGAISRAEHRRMKEEVGYGPGVIDVEFTDEDAVQPEDVPAPGQPPVEPDVVPVHQVGPDEQPRPPAHDGPAQPSATPAAPLVRKEPTEPKRYINGERDFGRDPAAPAPERPSPDVDTPDPYEQYGTKRGDARTYAEQVRDAEALAARRKEAHQRIQNAKKQRKIAKATGADAIADDITGATVDEDGKLTFD